MFVEDQTIESKAFLRIQQELGNSVSASVTSFNKRVLITGQAPTQKLKQRVEQIVAAIENVEKIHNEMQISGVTSLASTTSDALITTRVKSTICQVQDPEDFSCLKIKVVTENSVVYLIGIVTRAHAAIAIEAARNTSGVTRVVKVFEYLDVDG